MSRLRFAGVATLAGVLILGAVSYRAYGPSSPASEVVSDRGTSRRGGSIGRAVPVIVVTAEARDFVIRRRTIGILESPAIVIIRSRIDSQVLEQHVTDGQLVKKGDLLFTLDDREIQALIARDQAQLAKDNAALTQAAGRPGAQARADRQAGRPAAAGRSGDRRPTRPPSRRSRPTRPCCRPTGSSLATPSSRRRSPAASAPSA